MAIRSRSDIFPFKWQCLGCERLIHSIDGIYDERDIYPYFKEPIDLDEMDRHPILRRDPKIQDVLRDLNENESTAFIIEVDGICPFRDCRVRFPVKLWAEIELERRDKNFAYLNITDLTMLDGEGINTGSTPGFYRGVDIASGLNSLYMRWWYRQAQIYIVCPFIGVRELGFFEKAGFRMLKTYRSMGIDPHTYNPFRKIFTRKYSKHNFKRIEISQIVAEYLKPLSPDNFFLEGQQGAGLIFVLKDHLYEVENIPGNEYEGSDNIGLRFANYFHGKLYGACYNGIAEIVITSYNYVDVESLQLESLSFVRTTEEQLHYQIEKFESDRHMEISPVDISKII